MVRFLTPVCMLAALSACAPPVPNSGPVVEYGDGVGFGNAAQYDQARAAREAELRGINAPPGASSTDTLVANNAAAIDAAEQGTTTTASASPIRRETSNPGISDEQDFAAVSSRESIASDRDRIQQQRQQYEVVQPTAVPTRKGKGGPNIVRFALSTNNAVGQSVYKRAGLFADSKYQRNCAKYISADRAQLAFLEAGGPQRDRLGLDPDGDGFACSWDPTPFRNAQG